MIRLAPVLILSVSSFALGSPAASAGNDKKAPPAPKPSASPAKPSSSPSAAPSAAAAVPAKLTEQEKALRERVTEYWKNRVASNLHACYPYYEASFRSKYNADQFATDFRRLNRFAPEFMGIESATVDPSGAKAMAKVKLRTRPDVLQGEELLSIDEEVWVLEDGVWNKTGELTFPNI